MKWDVNFFHGKNENSHRTLTRINLLFMGEKENVGGKRKVKNSTNEKNDSF